MGRVFLPGDGISGGQVRRTGASAGQRRCTRHAPQCRPGGGNRGPAAVHVDEHATFAGRGDMLVVRDHPSLQFGSEEFVIDIVMRYDMPTSGLPGCLDNFGALFVKTAPSYPFRGPAIFANYGYPIANPVVAGQIDTTHYVAAESNSSIMYNDDVPRLITLYRSGPALTLSRKRCAREHDQDGLRAGKAHRCHRGRSRSQPRQSAQQGAVLSRRHYRNRGRFTRDARGDDVVGRLFADEARQTAWPA